jgi:CRP-like cAMP-binding protein
MANKTRSVRNTSTTVPEIEGNTVHNEILLGLPRTELASLFPQLTFVQLRLRDILEDSGQPIKYAYFVDSGLVSILSTMDDGKSVEVGLTGKEGCTGLPLAVGLHSSASHVVVQIEGTAFRISSQNLARVLPNCPALARRMQQYAQVMAMQGAQVAACNRLHEVDERLARWLLMSQDRIQSDLVPLTHEFLAHMLGTRRSSVTVAAGVLQKAGLITYNRGQVKVEDRTRLEEASCECYVQIRRYTAIWKKESL